MERYNRQMILPEIDKKGQQRLSKAKVLIVGVGGLGSPLATYLTGAGVGTIGIIDDDTVSISNLQRQVLYTEDEVGLPKAIQAKERLKRQNSTINIIAYPCKLTKENAEKIIGQYDIVADGCDNFATRYLINDTCLKLNKIYVYGAIRAFDGQVSVFNYLDGKNYRDLSPDEEETLSMPHPPKGVIGVTPGIIGCLEANEIIKIICGFGEVLRNKLFLIDLKNLSCNIINL